jgi:hypothetical protein
MAVLETHAGEVLDAVHARKLITGQTVSLAVGVVAGMP